MVLGVFAAVALFQAWPGLDGGFLSDDVYYITNNAYVQELSLENLLVLLDPGGEPVAYTANYAPMHLLLVAGQWALFGPEWMPGWNGSNALVHALASFLLVLFLLRSGLPLPAALFGGAFFLTHPANVETVLWIFQLKTLVALCLALGALLWLERRPGWATTLFALGLLTKITALFALPVAIIQSWVRAKDGGPAARWAWIGAWTAVALVVSVLEIRAYGIQDDPRNHIHDDPLVHARTIFLIAGRYLVMAASSWGVSTFHDPDPVLSWANPWWWGGLAGLALLGARGLWSLARRDEEAVYWTLAATSYLPVCQILPWVYPIGDRYLYMVLPGLIGGTLLALRRPAARLRAALEARQGWQPQWSRAAAAAGALALLALFSVRSVERAPVYRSALSMLMDAARNYPNGLEANLLQGFGAARRGDAEAAARRFGRAVELGFSDLGQLVSNPQLAPVRPHPAFQAVLRDLARRDVERIEGRADPSQMELSNLGLAHWVRGELEQAEEAYERALERGGALDPVIEERLRGLRRERSARRG